AWPAAVPAPSARATDAAPAAGVADAPAFSRDALQELMWADAGLVRDRAGLGHAASVLAAWRAQRRHPRTEREFEDENLLLVARALVAAALARRDSVGAHYRSDAPRATVDARPLVESEAV
ncbi:MAG: L-aspartate oxidase, partial [Microbacterium sp.]|nr:L-aspartate oxidase [Microbacterium sp.]